jgi:hypothetical protein
MRQFNSLRIVGCSTFVLFCAAGQAQINVTNAPNAFKSDYTESFEEFAPEGTTALAPTNVGGISGVSLFGGNAALTYTNSPSDGSTYSIYNTTTATFGLASAPNALVYTKDGGSQGLGVDAPSAPGAPVSVTISLLPGVSDQYFAGFFQAAYFENDPTNPYTGQITFTFYDNSTTPVESLIESTHPDPNNLSGKLVGMAFAFDPSYSYTSVTISGVGLAMDSLRIASTPLATPEPGSYAALGLGVGILALRRRRR